MAATQAEIDVYITDIRSAISDFGEKLATRQRIGSNDTFCERMQLMLLSAYLDCICDYFIQYPDDVDPDTTNFFTTSQIRDVMQHINNICNTNYILVNL